MILRRGYLNDKERDIDLNDMTPRLFGFWLPVHDEASARAAIKMAGLPLLLVGILLALVQLMHLAAPQDRVDWIILILCVSMILMAFRLRAGGTALAPLAACLGLLSFALQAVSVCAGLLAAEFDGVAFVAGMAALIVPLFAAALAVGGLRGWWWMRRNGVPRTV